MLTSPDGLQRARKRAGDDAEDLLAAHHEICARAGVAFVQKVPTAWKVIGRCARGLIVVPAHKTGVDYQGHLAGGAAVYIEAKRSSAPRFPLSRVEPHQCAALTTALRCGAVAVLVLVRCLPGQPVRIAAIPWSAIVRVRAGGRTELPTSLGPEEIAPHVVRSGEPYLKRFARRNGDE